MARNTFLDDWDAWTDRSTRRTRHEETKRPDIREWRATPERRDADSRPRDASQSSHGRPRASILTVSSSSWHLTYERHTSLIILSHLPASAFLYFFCSSAMRILSHSIRSSFSTPPPFSSRLDSPVLEFVFLSPSLHRALCPSHRATTQRIGERNGAHPPWTSLVACRPSGAVIRTSRDRSAFCDWQSWMPLRTPQCAVLDIYQRRILHQISHIGWFQLAMLEQEDLRDASKINPTADRETRKGDGNVINNNRSVYFLIP